MGAAIPAVGDQIEKADDAKGKEAGVKQALGEHASDRGGSAHGFQRAHHVGY